MAQVNSVLAVPRLTVEEIVEEMRIIFGAPCVTAEIKDPTIKSAIKRAVREFRRYLFVRKTIAIEQVTGVQVIELDDLGLPAGTCPMGLMRFDVLDTDRPTVSEGELNIFELYRTGIYGAYGYRLPGALHELGAHIEMSKRVRGTEAEWDWDPDANRLTLYVPAGPRDVGIDVGLPLQTLDDVPYEHEQLFLDYIEAQCRIYLGTVRGKYGGTIIGPTGDIQLDASDQLQMGREMKERVIEELKLLKEMPPPIYG